MTTSATMIVTQLINEGRQQHGHIDAIGVPAELFEQVLDEVVAAGGQVGFDTCEVDGVTVRADTGADGTPLVTPAGSTTPVPLSRAAAE